MLEALHAAGVDGMAGSALTRLFVSRGFAVDTAEKVKARLKAVGSVAHDPTRRLWWAPGMGPAQWETEREERIRGRVLKRLR
jgi:hypothetical protein